MHYICTVSFLTATSHIQGYQVHDISADGQCALSISCTVSDRTVATGCIFMYDSNGDGTLNSETFIILPPMGNTAEYHLIIDCNLNQLNFTLSAVSGIILSTTKLLDCAISGLHHVSSIGKQILRLYVSYSCIQARTYPTIYVCSRKNL